jgi:hypothetical protein
VPAGGPGAVMQEALLSRLRRLLRATIAEPTGAVQQFQWTMQCREADPELLDRSGRRSYAVTGTAGRMEETPVSWQPRQRWRAPCAPRFSLVAGHAVEGAHEWRWFRAAGPAFRGRRPYGSGSSRSDEFPGASIGVPAGGLQLSIPHSSEDGEVRAVAANKIAPMANIAKPLRRCSVSHHKHRPMLPTTIPRIAVSGTVLHP